MSDDKNVGGAAVDEGQTAAATDTAAAADTADAGGILRAGTAAADNAASAADTSGTTAWPDNWREIAAGGDEKALKRLQRYTAPGEITKALLAAQDRIAQGARVPSLPDDPTPEEVAAYRKSAGIPDKADGYGFKFPDEVGATESDQAVLADFMQHMLDKNVSPGAAQAAFDFQVKRLLEARTAQAEAAQEATIENMAELRKDFSPVELKRNMRLTEDFLQQHFGQSHESMEAIKQVLNLRLANGVKVEDYAPFMKGLFGVARHYADDEALIGGDAGGGGRSIEEEKSALVKKSATQRLTPAEDKRLDELIASQLKRDQRGIAA